VSLPPHFRYIADTSVLMALFLEEGGHENVLPKLGSLAMSAVTYSELISKAQNKKIYSSEFMHDLGELRLHVLPFDAELAEIAGSLLPPEKKRGVSFADRACLATARKYRLPVLTADRLWKDLGLDIPLEFIR